MRKTSPLMHAICRQLLESIQGNAPENAIASIERYDSTLWASATFEGHRHQFVIRFDGLPEAVDSSATRFQAMIAGDDIRLRGELLADLALVGDDQATGDKGVARRLYFEALTVKD